MPSSVGHALAGLVVSWSNDLVPAPPAERQAAARRSTRLAWTCAALAAAPDLDLVFHTHRTWSHSIGAVILVTIITGLVTRQVTRGPALRTGLVCGLALGTHVLLDWLAIDRYPPSGIQALWPFSDRWYVSGLDWFPQIQRQHFFSAATVLFNAHSIVQECIRLAPIVLLIGWLRRRACVANPAPVAGPRCED